MILANLMDLVILMNQVILSCDDGYYFESFDFGGTGDSGGNGNSDDNVDSSISGNSVEFSNSCECGASGESGSSVDSDISFNLYNRQKSKFQICAR